VADERSVAVVGCGHWGRNLVRNLSQLGRLGAVVEPTGPGRERAAELAPGVPVLDRLEDALARPEIRAVMVATPAETHFGLASTALAAGRHVFVEKPMTVDLDEAHELAARAASAGRMLMVGHLLEYHPAVLKLQELVREGVLGKIRYVISNRLNLGKIRTEENALWSFAPHDVAVILRLVGRMPFEVVATGGCYVQPNIADVTVTQLLFDNGVRSHIFVSWLHPFKEQKLVVIGSKKMACLDDISKKLTLTELRVDWEEGQPIPLRADGVEVPFPSDEPLRAEVQHFLDCADHGRTPLTDGASGIRVLEVLHAAQRSLVTNGRAVGVSSGPSASRGAASAGEGSRGAPPPGPPHAAI